MQALSASSAAITIQRSTSSPQLLCENACDGGAEMFAISWPTHDQAQVAVDRPDAHAPDRSRSASCDPACTAKPVKSSTSSSPASCSLLGVPDFSSADARGLGYQKDGRPGLHTCESKAFHRRPSRGNQTGVVVGGDRRVRIRFACERMREVGATWSEIGECLGVSHTTARRQSSATTDRMRVHYLAVGYPDLPALPRRPSANCTFSATQRLFQVHLWAPLAPTAKKLQCLLSSPSRISGRFANGRRCQWWPHRG